MTWANTLNVRGLNVICFIPHGNLNFQLFQIKNKSLFTCFRRRRIRIPCCCLFGVDFDWTSILQRTTRLGGRWWEQCLCSCLTHEAVVSGIKLGSIIICVEVIKQTVIIWRILLDSLARELQLLSFAIPRQHHEWIGTATTHDDRKN